MKKRLMLLPLLALVLVGCNKGGKESSSTDASSNTPTSSEVSSTNTNSSSSSSSSSTDVKDSESSSSQSSSSTVVEPAREVKTIDELAETPPTSADKLYEVEGIWVPDKLKSENDQYGNGKLVDPTSGKSLVVYGMAKDLTAFTYSENGYTFTNPKNYQDIFETSFFAGDKIKLAVIYSTQYKNYYTAFLGKVAESSTFTYQVTKNVGENGTATLSAESGTYGTEITITTSPTEGYKVESVTFNGQSLSPTEENQYKFKIVPVTNNVEVSFVEASYVATEYNITPTNLLGYTGENVGYPTSEQTKTVFDSGETITFKYHLISCHGHGLQTKQNAYLFNTTAFSQEIESITITKNAKWTGKGVWSISFGTAAIEAKPQSFAGTVDKDSETTVTINCEVSGAKYFRIDHTVSGAAYADSIVVKFKSASN